ncbi:MAG: CcmD family protein [Schleiferiaceae bacterium]
MSMKRFLQQGPPVEMADAFRADGKIWVVVAVVGVIFAGILAYLTWMDLRLRKAENSAK